MVLDPVVFHQGGLSSEWSLTTVLFYQDVCFVFVLCLLVVLLRPEIIVMVDWA